MMKWGNELSLERAKALLGEKKISDEQLLRVMEQINAFCKIAYQLYAQRGAIDDDLGEKLKTEPPDEFKTLSE